MDKYKRGVRKAGWIVANRIHPGLSISTEALGVIERIFVHLNEKLVISSLKHTPNTKVMTVQVAQKAVSSTLAGELQNLAIIEAHRCIARYKMGLLRYKILDKDIPTRLVPPPIEYSRCVKFLANLVNSEVKISTDAKYLVGNILQQMCKETVDRARTTAEGQEKLTVHDIVKSIDHSMTPNMGKFAISEGIRNTMLFIHGLTDYSEEKFKKFQR